MQCTRGSIELFKLMFLLHVKQFSSLTTTTLVCKAVYAISVIQMGSSTFYVELKLAAVDLRGRRLNPFAVLTRPSKTKTAADILEIARTETVWADSSPAFVRSFELACLDESSSPEGEFRIYIFSQSCTSDKLSRSTFLGYADFSVDRALAKPDGVLQRILRNRAGRSNSKRGALIICAERVRAVNTQHKFSIQFGFAAQSNVWGAAGGRTAKKVFYVRDGCHSLN